MNKLIKIALAAALFTSLASKAEEMAVDATHELQAHQAEPINYLEAIPHADEANLESASAAAEEEILEEAVSSEEAELPQS